MNIIRLTTVALIAVLSLLRSDAGAKDEPKPSAPEGATFLFGENTKDLSAWVGRNGKDAAWKIENGYLAVVPGAGDILTKEKFGDCELHVEFWVPLMEGKKGQARGNSGVFLQGRYEVQLLDSYGIAKPAVGDCAAIYSIIAPSKNACRRPEEWQSYDITFRAPRVDDKGKVTTKGEVTVVHNGVKVIDKGNFDRATGGELNRDYGKPGPIMLQDHGCKLRFRNIWIKPIK